MHDDLQDAAQEAGSTDIGAAEEDADAAGQQQGDQVQVGPMQYRLKTLDIKAGSGTMLQNLAQLYPILASVINNK